MNAARTGPICSFTLAAMSVSDTFSRDSQPGMHCLSTSTSLRAAHTASRLRGDPLLACHIHRALLAQAMRCADCSPCCLRRRQCGSSVGRPRGAGSLRSANGAVVVAQALEPLAPKRQARRDQKLHDKSDQHAAEDGTPARIKPASRARPPVNTRSVSSRNRTPCASMRGTVAQNASPMANSKPER